MLDISRLLIFSIVLSVTIGQQPRRSTATIGNRYELTLFWETIISTDEYIRPPLT